MTTHTRADGMKVVVIPKDRFTRLHERLRSRMPVWVVYRPTTREYPGSWVARMHVILPEVRPTRFVMTHDTVEGLREMLPSGLTRLARDPS